MMSFNRSFNYDFQDFLVENTSIAHGTKKIDAMVSEAHLSSDLTKKRESERSFPLTNVEYNQPNSIFRNQKDISLIYMTPEQKALFDHTTQCFIRGGAGTGKTLLMIFKIIEIVGTPQHLQTLVVAPYPHNIRCSELLKDNNVNVSEAKSFPPSTPTDHDVVVMETKGFFGVSKEVFNYDLSKYNLFIDDAQCISPRGDDNVTFSDIRVFFILLHNNSRHRVHLYRWIFLDVIQGRAQVEISKDSPSRLFTDEDNKPVQTLLIYQLQNTLRNSVEIGHYALRERNNRIEMLDYSYERVPISYIGHRIHGGAI